MDRDPWKHRSEGMRCMTCMWFVEKDSRPCGGGGGGNVPEFERRQLAFGRCRRHAPTMTGYPAVFGTDWCGDHKLDEASAK